MVTWWFDFGSDRNHHAACPIGNLAISQQIMSGFWWHFHYSPALIYLSTDWICEVMWIIKLTLQLGYMIKMRILNCLSWGLRSWTALVSECTMKQVYFTILDKFTFCYNMDSYSYYVVNYFHWPWLVTLGGNRHKCVKKCMYFSTNRWGISRVATCNHKADGPFHLKISIGYNMVIYNNKYCQQNQLSLNIINSNSTWLFSAVCILNSFTFLLSCIMSSPVA